MRRRHRGRQIVKNYLLSFVLMLSIMFISLMGMGKYSMLSARAVIHTCDRISYFDDIRDEMKTYSYRMGIPYGIEKKDLKKVYNSKQIRQDVYNVFKAQLAGVEYEINTDDIEQKLLNNVVENHGQLDAKQQESFDVYSEKVQGYYKSKMIIPTSEYIAKMINYSNRIALIGIPVAIFIAIMCMFFLISTRRRTYHGLRYVAYGFFGAGITLLTVFAAMISNGAIYKFNISDVYMRKFFTYWIGHEMLMQVFVGILLNLVGGILIYMVYRQKFRR